MFKYASEMFTLLDAWFLFGLLCFVFILLFHLFSFLYICGFVYRKWGFYCFLKDLFTAHDDVMRYLCQNYRIHDIPLGNDWTTKNADKVGVYNTQVHITILLINVNFTVF